MHLNEFIRKVLPVKNKLYRFSLRMLMDEDDAKDVVQDVLIKVWNKRQELVNCQNIEAWCMKITKNACVDRIREKSRRIVQPIDSGYEIMDRGDSPQNISEAQDTLKRIHAFINALPEKQKMVIQLRDIEGMSYQEIADVMEIDINQVKINLFRARKTIKSRIIDSDAYGL